MAVQCGECGRLRGILHGLVAGLDSYEIDDPMLAEPLRLARGALADEHADPMDFPADATREQVLAQLKASWGYHDHG